MAETGFSGTTGIPRGTWDAPSAVPGVCLEYVFATPGAGANNRSDVAGTIGGERGRSSCISGGWVKLGGLTVWDFELFGSVPRGGAFSTWGGPDPVFSPRGVSSEAWSAHSLVTIFLDGFAVFLEVGGLVVAWGGTFNGMDRDGFDVSIEVGRLVTVGVDSFDCIDRDRFMGPPAR